jgi:alpha-tubulin suppressor-like RCC1 family protein
VYQIIPQIYSIGIYADKAKANRFCDMKGKMKNTIAAYAVMFLLLIVFLYKPFSHASAKSAVPNVVSGMRHTVALKSNGMVVATGLNQHGQCNVSSWRDIVQIAAGGYFTVGLKSDGTVLAAGSNRFGELNKTSSLSILKTRK